MEFLNTLKLTKRRHGANNNRLDFPEHYGGVMGIEHDTRRGLLFNGYEKEHWNNPIFGTKYSVIFFTCKYSQENIHIPYAHCDSVLQSSDHVS